MEEPTRKLGPYKLVSKIGRGAFGIVWLAEKQTIIATTQFALKLSRDEELDLEAFRQEAAVWIQASGHPNVLPLIDADIYDEQVVIVSEYVPDGSLASWLKRHGGKAPSIEAACEMIGGVLAGLAHLHERRIIHRDLKPDNILLQRGVPRLADFGIARLLRAGSYSTNVSGTLAYMAPEAFDGKRNERTDIWSVGVIFYQLLAGRLPFEEPDTASLIGAITRHDAPPLPETLPEVLRAIVIKALQREPDKRYASAEEMRRELRDAEHKLWLGEQQTVIDTVIPPTPIHGSTVKLPLPNELQSPVPAVTAEQPDTIVSLIIPAKGKSRRRLWLAGIVGVLLLGIVSLIGLYRWLATQKVTQSPGSFVLKQTLTGHTNIIESVAFSPDGKMLASASGDKTVIWDVQAVTPKQILVGDESYSVAFSPDSKTLATGGRDNVVKLWDIKTSTLKQSLTGHREHVIAVAFSPDGRMLLSASVDKLRVWDTQTGTLKQTLTGNRVPAHALAFSPDGKILAGAGGMRVGNEDTGVGAINLWDVQTGTLMQTLKTSAGINSIAFSVDGKILACGVDDNTVQLWDTQTSTLKQTLTGHSKQVESVAFSPDGKTLASGSADHAVKLWDVQTGALKQSLTENDWVNSVAFSPDGKILASGSWDKTVKLWQVSA